MENSKKTVQLKNEFDTVLDAYKNAVQDALFSQQVLLSQEKGEPNSNTVEKKSAKKRKPKAREETKSSARRKK